MFSAYGVLTAEAGWCLDPSAQTGMECKILFIWHCSLRTQTHKILHVQIGHHDRRWIIIKWAKFAYVATLEELLYLSCFLREYCGWGPSSESIERIYRGPGFLAVVWFGSTPTPFLPLSRQQVNLSVFLSLPGCVADIELTDGMKGGGARSQKNHTSPRKACPP